MSEKARAPRAFSIQTHAEFVNPSLMQNPSPGHAKSETCPKPMDMDFRQARISRIRLTMTCNGFLYIRLRGVTCLIT